MKSRNRWKKVLASLISRFRPDAPPAPASGRAVMTSYVAQEVQQRPRPHIMVAFQKSHEQYAQLYERLAEGQSKSDGPITTRHGE